MSTETPNIISYEGIYENRHFINKQLQLLTAGLILVISSAAMVVILATVALVASQPTVPLLVFFAVIGIMGGALIAISNKRMEKKGVLFPYLHRVNEVGTAFNLTEKQITTLSKKARYDSDARQNYSVRTRQGDTVLVNFDEESKLITLSA